MRTWHGVDVTFAVTVSPLSYSGLPLAFIAKQPSSPFRLPNIVDGKLSNRTVQLTVNRSNDGYAWFAVTVSLLSYSGLPLALIAKQPSSPFRLPDIVDGKLNKPHRLING